MGLSTGDKLPNISLLNKDETMVNIQDKIGNNLVIYFYPKDLTPGCTKEACSFRDNYERIVELGAEVIGISNDSPATHRKFTKTYRLNYQLLTDQSKKAEKAFGVERNLFGLIPGRETFIFDKNGILVKKFSSQLAATQHVDEAIKALEKINK